MRVRPPTGGGALGRELVDLSHKTCCGLCPWCGRDRPSCAAPGGARGVGSATTESVVWGVSWCNRSVGRLLVRNRGSFWGGSVVPRTAPHWQAVRRAGRCSCPPAVRAFSCCWNGCSARWPCSAAGFRPLSQCARPLRGSRGTAGRLRRPLCPSSPRRSPDGMRRRPPGARPRRGQYRK